MKVMKFGGTSVGSPARMKEVVDLVLKDDKPVFVVLSAMSGTTTVSYTHLTLPTNSRV